MIATLEKRYCLCPHQYVLPSHTRQFYFRSLDLLDASDVRYAVGGAHCLATYTGIERHTKDLDVFVKPADRDRALELFAVRGYRTELTHPHWVAKVFDSSESSDADGPDFIDIIYGSGNGLTVVDDQWLDHARRG